MKLLPEAIALRARIERDRITWDAATLAAATALLCELEVANRREWRTWGGPQRMAAWLEAFESRLAMLKESATGMTE